MTFTRLRVGTPEGSRSKLPRLGPPCVEPLILSSNVLRDPGFELMNGITGKTEIPEFDLLWENLTYQDTTDAPITVSWANTVFTGSTVPWDLSTAGEESGTYSARMVGTADGPTQLAVIGLVGCGDGDFYSGRCEPGNFTQSTCRAIVDSTSGTPNILIFHEWFAQDGSFIDSSDLVETPLTTSYATYSTPGGFAPATAFYLRVYHRVTNDNGRTIYIDNAKLEVS